MATTQELLLVLDPTTEGLRRELQRADTTVQQFGNKVDSRLAKIEGSFDGLGGAVGKLRGALGALGLALGVNELVQLGFKAAATADDLLDMANQLGLSTEALQEFQYMGRQNGIEAGKLQLALQTLNRTIGEAATGSKSAQDKFKGLGIAFLDGQGRARGAEDVLGDLAEVIKALPDPAARAAAAATLLGAKAGPQLVPALSDGIDGLREYATAARDAGEVMSNETVAQLAAANQAWEDLGTKVTVATGKVIAGAMQITAEIRKMLGLYDESSLREQEEKLFSLNEEMQKYLNRRGDIFHNQSTVEAQIKRINGEIDATFKRINELQQRAANQNTPVTPITISTDTGQSDAQKKAEQLTKALSDLQAQVAALDQSAEESLLAQWLNKAGVERDSPAGTQIAAMVEQLNNAAIATAGLQAAQQADQQATAEWSAAMARGKSITENLQTPLESYQATLAELKSLLDQGAISQDTFNRATQSATKTYQDAITVTSDVAEDLQQGLRDATQAVGTAFEDAVLNGERLRDVVRGLAQDIGRMLLRLSVTKPLEGFVGNLFGSIFGNGLNASIDNMIASNPAIFAGGGVMTKNGPVPLRKYAGGGIARSPQVAIFGEGSTPEAYVPVPNGRIPVELNTAPARGNGVVINQQITINSDAGSPEENEDNAQRMAKAMKRQMIDLIDSRLIEAKRGGGIYNGGQVI
jgi:hypothetical protein